MVVDEMHDDAIAHAKVAWRDGKPYSLDYQDIYFDQQAGLDESDYVFLQHNGLPARWKSQANFVIGEIGFGTGLRFLTTWQRFQASATGGTLHYISVEHRPLILADIRRSHQAWPRLLPLSEQLCQQYPPLFPGFHRLHFSGNVILTLLWGDALTQWRQVVGMVDAWFLDGFSPQKNPACFTASLFQILARCSHSQTTFATYSASNQVRQALEMAGFLTEKRAGFGNKRHLLCGRYMGACQAQQPLYPSIISNPRIAIIGGGLAGCSVAFSAARRGMACTIFEAAPQIAAAGSGHPMALINGRLSPFNDLLDQYYTNAAFYAGYVAEQMQENGWAIDFKRCGMAYLAVDAKRTARLKKLLNHRPLPAECYQWLTPQQLAEQAGIDIDCEGLYLPWVSLLNPKKWCETLCASEWISVLTREPVRQLNHVRGEWVIETPTKTWSFDCVVLAMGLPSVPFHYGGEAVAKPLRKCPGQMIQLKTCSQAHPLRTILYHRGYLTPAMNGYHALGATYRYADVENVDVLPQEHRQIIAPWLAVKLPMIEALSAQPVIGRASQRMTSKDYLPFIGPIALDASNSTAFPLLMTTAHGSRGVSSALLAAETILSGLKGEPLPIGREVALAIAPNRPAPSS